LSDSVGLLAFCFLSDKKRTEKQKPALSPAKKPHRLASGVLNSINYDFYATAINKWFNSPNAFPAFLPDGSAMFLIQF